MKKFYKNQYAYNRVIIFLIFLLLSISCSRKGIMEGGEYKSDNMHSIKTFYIYDYISGNDIKYHAFDIHSQNNKPLLNYYFSHNANIPTHSLNFASSYSEAENVISQYSSNLKYVVSIDDIGALQFFDCSIDSLNNYCGP